MDSVKTNKSNYIFQNKVAYGRVDSIVEDNKDGDRSQMKGADYIHSYIKQGLGGS
jgi:hypothetical protein